MSWSWLWLGLACLGCTSPREYFANGFKVGPNYARQCAPVAPDWIDAADVRIRRDSVDHSDWWQAFNDPKFDQLIHNAYHQNLSLRAAGYRILQARATRDQVAGNLFPQRQQIYADYNNNQRSLQAVNAVVTPNRHFDLWDVGSNLAWEIDLWGRFRRAIEAADADLDASIENYDDMLVILLGDLGTAYMQARTYELRIELARKNVAAQRGAFEIAQARFRAGAASELDVDQARTILSQTEAAIPLLEASWRVANNQICVLTGRPPEDLTPWMGPGPIPVPPTEVVMGIPAELLRRRPDVRRAERNLAAQSARIGVAETDLYPALTLNGDVSVRAQKFEDLFESGASAYSMGPSVRWNILNYGRLRNNIRVQDARFDELTMVYQNAVLNANREAENGLAQFLKAQERVRVLQEGVTAADRSFELVVKSYREGKVDFNRVFNIAVQLAQQQDALAQAEGDVAIYLVAVYRALGGGWQIRMQGDGPTWCEGCCRDRDCCPDDYCRKPCPICPPCGSEAPGTCGPPEISYGCPCEPCGGCHQ